MIIRTLVVGRDRDQAERLSAVIAGVADLEPTIVVLPVDLEKQLISERFGLVIWPKDAVDDSIRDIVVSARKGAHPPEFAVLLDASTADERTRLMASGFIGLIETEASDRLLRESLHDLVKRIQENTALHIAANESESEFLTAGSESAAIRRVLDMAERVARTDSSVLLLGETGTGKEWLARHLHSLGPRSHNAFIPVNCAAIPSELLESELFGHERGAFTGAHRTRRGTFELAHRGTLLLDEVGEMPVSLQAKLLRVLQDREFRRVGAETPSAVDVRVLAATNRDPLESIEAGSLRADLYYRLAVITIAMPTLRDRREDIQPLFKRFLTGYAQSMGTTPLPLAPSAIKALEHYSWPGNVRELMNVAERTVILSEGTEITANDLPLSADPATKSSDGLEATARRAIRLPLEEARSIVVRDFERRYLEHNLRKTRGHVGRAAARSGIDPKTLYSKMKAHGLDKADFKLSAKPENSGVDARNFREQAPDLEAE